MAPLQHDSTLLHSSGWQYCWEDGAQTYILVGPGAVLDVKPRRLQVEPAVSAWLVLGLRRKLNPSHTALHGTQKVVFCLWPCLYITILHRMIVRGRLQSWHAVPCLHCKVDLPCCVTLHLESRTADIRDKDLLGTTDTSSFAAGRWLALPNHPA